jgi:hypothetical protein
VHRTIGVLRTLRSEAQVYSYPRSMSEPRRDHYIAPATGADSEAVLDAAIASLGTLRGLEWVGDAGATLHLVASLFAEARSRVPRAVADARDQEYSWAQIADLLGVTRASVWQRYAGRTTKDRTPLEPD